MSELEQRVADLEQTVAAICEALGLKSPKDRLAAGWERFMRRGREKEKEEADALRE